MKTYPCILFCLFFITNFASTNEVPPHQQFVGPYHSFPYESQLIEGYLGHWLDNAIEDELFQFPIEDYLFPYYTSGITNGRWITGEFTGKYMHSMCMAYAYKFPKDDWKYKELKSRMDMILHAWKHFQKKNDGYVGIHISNDRAPWEDMWNVWHVKYVLLGFVKYYELFGDRSALEAAEWLADSFIKEFGKNKRGFEGSELGPVFLESMAMLYKHSGKQRFLEACYWIIEEQVQPELIDLINEEGRLPYKHTYTMQSHLISMLELYEIEGKNHEYLAAAEKAVDIMVKNKRFVTGGFATSEFFTTDGVFGSFHDDHPQEACTSAHFIYLCRKLFFITGDPKYINYIEYTLYNSALTSKNPNNGWKTSYYSPLQGVKEWLKTHHKNGTPCCSQSITRELTWLPEYTWAKSRENGLAVLLYTEGQLTDSVLTKSGEEVKLEVQLETDYPMNGEVTLQISPEREATFEIQLRVPDWVGKFEAKTADKTYTKNEGGFLKIQRLWKPGDTMKIRMDFRVAYVENTSMPGYVAVRRGPQVLAVDAAVNFGVEKLDSLRVDVSMEPELIAVEPSKLPNGWWGTQVYTMNSLVEKGVMLVPYAEVGQLEHVPYVTLIRVKDDWSTIDDSEFLYEGSGWIVEEKPYSHFGGEAHVTHVAGDSAEITFEGEAVELYSCSIFNPWSIDKRKPTIMEIFLNGESQGLFSATELHHQRLIFKKEGLPKKKHTLRIVNQDQFSFIDYVRFR